LKSKSRTPKSKLCLLLAAVFFTAGCASVFNPYDDEFQCPDTDKGGCMSIPEAYDISLSGMPSGKGNNPAAGKVNRPSSHGVRYDYLDKKYKEMTALIADPATPLVAPPDVKRILILSYTGKENTLFGYRYIYFFATEPEWIISSGKE
jgi:conjugal transfer pilus assembly protein TraV